MSKLARQLKFYAESYPKASSAALIGGTVIAFAAVVGFIEVQDAIEAQRHSVAKTQQDEAQQSTPSANVTPQEAQLVAMLENAKNSSWQDNLRNAADAQARFILPGRDVDEGKETPEYIQKIVDRSEEILKEDKARMEKEIEESKDPYKSRFWK